MRESTRSASWARDAFGHFPSEHHQVDDKTWADLNMDPVFNSINYTRTTVGAAELYRMLRTPVMDTGYLAERRECVEDLQEDPGERSRIQRVLKGVGEQKGGSVHRSLWAPRWKRADALPYTLMGTMPFMLLGLTVFYGGPFGLLLIVCLIANAIIHYKTKREVEADASSLFYINRLLNAARKLVKLPVRTFETESERLEEIGKQTRRLRRRTAFFFPRTGGFGDLADVFVEYLSVLLLLEVRTYFRSVGEVMQKISELRELCELIGTIDAVCAVSEAFTYVEEPTCLSEVHKDAERIHMEGGYPALIDDPVANSVELGEPGVILTGTNMSGKSTFLRTLGVNQIAAVTITAVWAERFVTGPFPVASSIGKSDDLLAAESLYYAEAKRLKTLVRGKSSVRRLLLFDEVLIGTNSDERVAITIALLRYLIGKRVISLLATHDLEIPHAVENVYRQCFFGEQVSEGTITFDYKLREGVIAEKNAIRLIETMGFPDELLEELSGLRQGRLQDAGIEAG